MSLHQSSFLAMLLKSCFPRLSAILLKMATLFLLFSGGAANSHHTRREQKGGDSSLAYLDNALDVNVYDKRLWPTYNTGQPTKVEVNIYVNSLSSISAANMEYTMDIYLRQAWADKRLRLDKDGVNHTIVQNGEELSKQMWTPDLFFRNVKQADFHFVTVPNKLMRIQPTGKILYSMRLTLRLACHMGFRKYPLDAQRCMLMVGSYAQTTDQVEVTWQGNNPIKISEPVELPEFDLVAFEYGSFLRKLDTGTFGFLNVTFTLQRQNGYHLVQTYLPTFLIVMISWVSFWLSVDAAPARVTLGVTTLLTLTTLASGIRTQLPPVSYVKAIDVWIGACSVMVFGALLEFTLVNYLSRSKIRTNETSHPHLKKTLTIFARKDKFEIGNCNNQSDCHSPENIPVVYNVKFAITVDRASRILFPLGFFIFNLIYWPSYILLPD